MDLEPFGNGLEVVLKISCSEQALAQLCAVCSPHSRSMSAVAISRELSNQTQIVQLDLTPDPPVYCIWIKLFAKKTNQQTC